MIQQTAAETWMSICDKGFNGYRFLKLLTQKVSYCCLTKKNKIVSVYESVIKKNRGIIMLLLSFASEVSMVLYFDWLISLPRTCHEGQWNSY